MDAYRLKLRLQRAKAWPRLAKLLERLPGVPAFEDTRPDLIQRLAPNKSFLDVGCMWSVNGKYCFMAEEAGASRVTGLDVYPASPEFTAEFEQRDSKVKLVQGDVHDVRVRQELGTHELVYCGGVLYHTPNPVGMLLNLRQLCSDKLILDTSTIPEIPLFRNMAVFYPFLDAPQRELWNRGLGRQRAITGPYEPESGYGNWFWGFTPSCLTAMLQCAGLEVLERSQSPFRVRFLCQAVEPKFSPDSGDWSTPADPSYAKLKR